MRGRGNGKLILVGEHAVVHGFPAIAFAVSLCTEVRFVATPVEQPNDPRLAQALQLAAPHEHVEIRTTLPIGRGMGSSAALAVALVRARAAAASQDLTPESTFEAAMPLECVFHGNPSGVDVAVSCHRTALKFWRGKPPRVEPLELPNYSFVVLDSGEVGNTAELVAHVASQRPAIDPILAEIGQLVDEAANSLHDASKLGGLMSKNQSLLQRIGVSTPKLDALCKLAMRHGALGAKLAGAGGGGVVLALTPDPAPLLAAAKREGVWAIHTTPEHP